MPTDLPSCSPAPEVALRPVFLGTDPGTYGLARALHEKYGVRTTIVSRGQTGPIANSRILDNVEAGENTDRAQLLRTLLDEGRVSREREPDVALLLGCNSDSHTELIAEHAEELGAYFAFPRMSSQTLEQIADKQSFGQICERLGLPTPRTVVVPFAEADDPTWEARPDRHLLPGRRQARQQRPLRAPALPGGAEGVVPADPGRVGRPGPDAAGRWGAAGLPRAGAHPR
ncbi:hypothetical protein [Serinicoccus marinus]|uniref:hypothetical protein n=1 Tax=Serinicoccus marinus TaxID=247333 RepID=UPI00122E8B39|nr:hypothetical protein [Serinicoccus marinus]